MSVKTNALFQRMLSGERLLRISPMVSDDCSTQWITTGDYRVHPATATSLIRKGTLKLVSREHGITTYDLSEQFR